MSHRTTTPIKIVSKEGNQGVLIKQQTVKQIRPVLIFQGKKNDNNVNEHLLLQSTVLSS